MRIWTVQHEAVLAIAREKGIFRADGRRIDQDFRQPYMWLRKQVKERILGAKGRPLIWAWYQPKPDLRSSCLLYTGTPGVRVELEIPDERVLLSCFDGWHFRLSSNYLPTSNSDGDDHHRRWDAECRRLYGNKTALTLRNLTVGQTNAILRDEIEASWPRMFDLDLMRRTFCTPDMTYEGYEQHIQAVFEFFTEDEIRKVSHFKAR